MTPFEKLTVQLTVAGLLLAAFGLLATIFTAEIRAGMTAARAGVRSAVRAAWLSSRWIRMAGAAIFFIAALIIVFRAVSHGPAPNAKYATSLPLKAEASNERSTKTRVVHDVHFVLIPAGESSIGCTIDDDQCGRNELPPHPVRFAAPFWMSATEITTSQFQRCVAQQRCTSPSGESLLQHPGVEHLPVTWVTADDARKFCSWLGGDLPTETEWEYAARGGLPDCRYPRGKAITPKDAKYRGGGSSGVAPVRSFAPNLYGLYDMAGNVAELCQGPPASDGRPFIIVRGGSYDTSSDRLRVSARTVSDWSYAGPAIGFRCVLRNP